MESHIRTISRFRRKQIEKLLCVQEVEVLFLREELESNGRIDLSVDACRKVVEHRSNGVKLNRMPPIWRRYERPMCNA